MADRYQYGLDVGYEVWRSGGNPDRVNPDRVDSYFHGGLSAEAAAGCVLRGWRDQRESQEMADAYEQRAYEEAQREAQESAEEEQRMTESFGPRIDNGAEDFLPW